MLKNIVLLCIAILRSRGAPSQHEQWNGKWFPHPPGEPDLNPTDWNGKWFPESPSALDSNPEASLNHLHDPHHGILMGVQDPSCDDAQSHLEIDWYMNPENYSCYMDRNLYLPKSVVHPIHKFEHIPKFYSAPHKCMNESIEYNQVIPTFGAHRPLWAIYGEYRFLPKQRWIHNLEHGAVVMLYHPCANKNEVALLRKLVKACLYRHVITPYNLLSHERPLALVTWGHSLEMSKVASEVVVDFIKQHALRGPEKTYRDGQYHLLLDSQAKVVSNVEDADLCPNYNSRNMK